MAHLTIYAKEYLALLMKILPAMVGAIDEVLEKRSRKSNPCTGPLPVRLWPPLHHLRGRVKNGTRKNRNFSPIPWRPVERKTNREKWAKTRIKTKDTAGARGMAGAIPTTPSKTAPRSSGATGAPGASAAPLVTTARWRERDFASKIWTTGEKNHNYCRNHHW